MNRSSTGVTTSVKAEAFHNLLEQPGVLPQCQGGKTPAVALVEQQWKFISMLRETVEYQRSTSLVLKASIRM